MKKFGECLYNALAERKMTQKELADEIGVADRSVRRWIHTDIVPTRKTMKKISDVLGIKVYYETEQMTL